MPMYAIPLQTNAFTFKEPDAKFVSHQLIIQPEGGNLTAGTMKIEARMAGSDTFALLKTAEDITSPMPITFSAAVAEWRFTLTGPVGTAGRILITDNQNPFATSVS